MAEEYTPSTGTIRQAYTGEPCGDIACTLGEVKNAEFDRWLTAHDAQVKAEAWGEGAEMGHRLYAESIYTIRARNPHRRAAETEAGR